MSEIILMVKGKQLVEKSREEWEQHLSRIPKGVEKRLSFMTEEHHLVRYFVVKELPGLGKPISPEHISENLKLPHEKTVSILDDLEKNLTFLVRDKDGNVSWAFPFTVDNTPHKLTFSTGDRLNGACAEDSIAAPFVQGRLRDDYLSVEIKSECACCSKQMNITLDSELDYPVKNKESSPYIFEPDIDWKTFTEPNIIHAY